MIASDAGLGHWPVITGPGFPLAPLLEVWGLASGCIMYVDVRLRRLYSFSFISCFFPPLLFLLGLDVGGGDACGFHKMHLVFSSFRVVVCR